MSGDVRRIGRYVVDERLGTGTFSTVHQVIDERTGDVVALKLLAENWSSRPDVKGHFVAEARLLRRIRSDRVISVFDLGETASGQPYFTMEVATGGTLEERLKVLRERGWTPTCRTMRHFIEALASTVEQLHREDHVHRDLKPANLMLLRRTPGDSAAPLLLRDERLVVGDLGFAIAAGDVVTKAAGTAGYAAPEQGVVGGVVDRRSDVYALAAIVADIVCQPEVDRIDQLKASAQPLARALLKGLANQPDTRPPTTTAWAALTIGSLDTRQRQVRL